MQRLAMQRLAILHDLSVKTRDFVAQRLVLFRQQKQKSWRRRGACDV